MSNGLPHTTYRLPNRAPLGWSRYIYIYTIYKLTIILFPPVGCWRFTQLLLGRSRILETGPNGSAIARLRASHPVDPQKGKRCSQECLHRSWGQTYLQKHEETGYMSRPTCGGFAHRTRMCVSLHATFFGGFSCVLAFPPAL